jgi:hypothetical protein
MEKISRRGLFGLIGAALAARKFPKLIAPSPFFGIDRTFAEPIKITGIQGWLPDTLAFRTYYEETYENLAYRDHVLLGLSSGT